MTSLLLADTLFIRRGRRHLGSVTHRLLSTRKAPRRRVDVAELNRRRAVKISGAPPSIDTIPDRGYPSPNDSAFIRGVGCTRRVFILQPYFNSDELEGLAYRIKALGTNEAINSVLIATDGSDDSKALPSCLKDRNAPRVRHHDPALVAVDAGLPPAPGKTWHFSSGYDPLKIYETGMHKNTDAMMDHLGNLSKLALSVRGDKMRTKVPVITIPHGAILDGGFALCMGGYVLASSRETCYRILNPSKGLSLDPVGLSYLLPRLGTEFRQGSSKFPGCGMILGLTGYEANAMDMVETGLATHYVEGSGILGLLEMTLAEIPPWNQQNLLKQPKRYLGEPEPDRDHNAAHRNVQVAAAIHAISAFPANANADYWTLSEEDHHLVGHDPSLETDPTPWHAERDSDLVNYAATFYSIFKYEHSLVGILEALREIAGQSSNDPEEQQIIDDAADFVKRIERQSPLALSVVHRLLSMGRDKHETIETCMAREQKVQAKLFGNVDFEMWAKYASVAEETDQPFTGWKHKSLADVSQDEVSELIES